MKNSNAKTMIRKLLLLVALVAANGAEAQIKTILNESLVNRFEVSDSYCLITDENKPSVLNEWSFDNCWVLTNNNIQVGSSEAKGTVTTPLLTNCTGNLRVNTSFYAIDDDISFASWLLEDDDYTEQKYCYTVTEIRMWKYDLPTMVYRNPGPQPKIIFYSADADGKSANRRFQTADIKVCDIGENLFYETFDVANGVGGNDATYDVSDAKTAKCENPLSYFDKVYSANKCVGFIGTGQYITCTLPLLAGRNAILSFKIAGTDNEGAHHVDVSTTGGATVSTIVNNATAREWKDVEVTITGLGSNEKIVFEGFNIFLDEICIREKASTDLTMNQTDGEGDNVAFDAMTLGTVANVTLTRTLTAGIWNTLCLPFRFDNTMLAGENHILRLTSVTDGCFNFTEDDVVPAGEPFLLQVSSTTDNPTFNNVTIRTKSPGTKMFGGYGLQGIFYATDLKTDESNAFLGADGSLYYPADKTKTMNGLRAYFVKPASAPARVSFSFFEPAAIREVHREAVAREYNLWGQRVTSSRRGIIVRNGKKVYRQ